MHMQIFPLPRWFEDLAVVASSAFVHYEVIDKRRLITRLSRKLLYFPVLDKALWVSVVCGSLYVRIL